VYTRLGTSGQLISPGAVCPGNGTAAHTEEEAGWTPEAVWTFREKGLLHLLEIGLPARRSVLCWVCRTDCAKLGVLCWLRCTDWVLCTDCAKLGALY
jgi:hypothetical protein